MIPSIISTQYLAGYSALLSVLAAAGCYAWVTPIMDYFLDPESEMYMTSTQAGFMLAVIEFGELAMSIPAGILADKYGRKVCIIITGPMYASSWVVILIWKSYIVLCAMRILQGIAMALTFAIVPLYLGEISSPYHRGSITGLFSFAWFCGYIVLYCVGPFVSYFAFTIFTACIPVIFTLLFIYQPESPFYLLMKGKITEATEVLTWLRNGYDTNSIMSELEDMKISVSEELQNKPSWKDIIDTPADKRSLIIILVIGFTRILSGGIAIQSYSTKLYSEAGATFLSPDTLTIIMGIFLLVGGIVNAFIVDLIGRRPLLFISYIGCSLSLLTVGIYFLIKNNFNVDTSSYDWAVPLGVTMYCIFSVIGMYPISMTYTSELFTAKTRGKAAGISTINLTIGSFICIEFYQLVGDNFGLAIVFFFFTAVCLVGVLTLYFIAPETKGKTFSQIRSDILNPKNSKVFS